MILVNYEDCCYKITGILKRFEKKLQNFYYSQINEAKYD